MERVKEITVFLENEPGALARIAASLAEGGVNIMGFDLSNSLDFGALRLVVDEPSKALHLFGERNLLALENEVIMLRLGNDVGALNGGLAR